MSEAIRASVEAFLSTNGISFAVRYVGEIVKDKTKEQPKGWQCDQWEVSLTCAGKDTIVTPYYTGLGLRKGYKEGDFEATPRGKAKGTPKPPHAADVLHSLVLDSSAINESFPDWCENFGYDSDSIKALRTYEQCCATGLQLRDMLGSAGLQTLSELLQDY